MANESLGNGIDTQLISEFQERAKVIVRGLNTLLNDPTCSAARKDWAENKKAFVKNQYEALNRVPDDQLNRAVEALDRQLSQLDKLVSGALNAKPQEEKIVAETGQVNAEIGKLFENLDGIIASDQSSPERKDWAVKKKKEVTDRFASFEAALSTGDANEAELELKKKIGSIAAGLREAGVVDVKVEQVSPFSQAAEVEVAKDASAKTPFVPDGPVEQAPDQKRRGAFSDDGEDIQRVSQSAMSAQPEAPAVAEAQQQPGSSFAAAAAEAAASGNREDQPEAQAGAGADNIVHAEQVFSNDGKTGDDVERVNEPNVLLGADALGGGPIVPPRGAKTKKKKGVLGAWWKGLGKWAKTGVSALGLGAVVTGGVAVDHFANDGKGREAVVKAFSSEVDKVESVALEELGLKPGEEFRFKSLPKIVDMYGNISAIKIKQLDDAIENDNWFNLLKEGDKLVRLEGHDGLFLYFEDADLGLSFYLGMDKDNLETKTELRNGYTGIISANVSNLVSDIRSNPDDSDEKNTIIAALRSFINGQEVGSLSKMNLEDLENLAGEEIALPEELKEQYDTYLKEVQPRIEAAIDDGIKNMTPDDAFMVMKSIFNGDDKKVEERAGEIAKKLMGSDYKSKGLKIGKGDAYFDKGIGALIVKFDKVDSKVSHLEGINFEVSANKVMFTKGGVEVDMLVNSFDGEGLVIKEQKEEVEEGAGAPDGEQKKN